MLSNNLFLFNVWGQRDIESKSKARTYRNSHDSFIRICCQIQTVPLGVFKKYGSAFFFNNAIRFFLLEASSGCPEKEISEMVLWCLFWWIRLGVNVTQSLSSSNFYFKGENQILNMQLHRCAWIGANHANTTIVLKIFFARFHLIGQNFNI